MNLLAVKILHSDPSNSLVIDARSQHHRHHRVSSRVRGKSRATRATVEKSAARVINHARISLDRMCELGLLKIH